MEPEVDATTRGVGRPTTSSAWMRFPAVPIALTIVFALFTLAPPVSGNARLIQTFVALASGLFVWEAVLVLHYRRTGSRFRVEPTIVKSHYVQAGVQFCVYVYWGWHWKEIGAHVPQLLAQVVFLYNFEALLSYSRGRSWRPGFGPLPIVFSTNLLLWFRHDWFYLQFAMIVLGALGKEFIKWERDGKRTHIFNPSVFGQSLMAIALIAAGATSRLTRGEEMAYSFETLPNMLVVLFLLGLVVQYNFAVTLMTMSATAVLCLVNLVYTHVVGTYYFTTITIGATIFLGLHLLVTDPSTSPRTHVGRVLFGASYGLGYAVLYRVLGDAGVPIFWDKLLAVPILNLCVPLFDRFARSGFIGRVNSSWESALRPRAMNLVHMSCWVVMFLTIVWTGFAAGPKEARSIAFWYKAYEEGRYHAGETLLELVKYGASRNSGEACNLLGKIYLEGKLVEKDDAKAAHYFAKACELGFGLGCENLVWQFLTQRRTQSPEDLTRAIDALERTLQDHPDGRIFFLVGIAYEMGIGRPANKLRALTLYRDGCNLGNTDCCTGLSRIRGQG